MTRHWIFLLTVVVFSKIARAATLAGFTPEEFANLPPETQKYYLFEKRAKADGASHVTTMGFEKQMAMTRIVSRKKTAWDPIYTTEVIANDRLGVSIMFRAYKKCSVTDQNKLIDTTILVDDVKIRAYYGCAPTNDGDTQQIFLPYSEAGKDAIYKAFKRKTYVFVELNGTQIPFRTIGFDTAWAEAFKPAL